MNCNDGCDNHEDDPCQCCLQSVDDDVSISKVILNRKYIRQNQCDGFLNITGDTIIYECMREPKKRQKWFSKPNRSILTFKIMV